MDPTIFAKITKDKSHSSQIFKCNELFFSKASGFPWAKGEVSPIAGAGSMGKSAKGCDGAG